MKILINLKDNPKPYLVRPLGEGLNGLAGCNPGLWP